MIMPLNLVVSYLASLLGTNVVYREKEDQKKIISIGLFIGSCVALMTLLIYFLSGNDQIYVPIILSALMLGYEWYLTSKSKDESFSGVEDIPNEAKTNINLLMDDEEEKENNKKISIDDLINE